MAAISFIERIIEPTQFLPKRDGSFIADEGQPALKESIQGAQTCGGRSERRLEMPSFNFQSTEPGCAHAKSTFC